MKALVDDPQADRFKAGQVFELPFQKALAQLERKTVEPVFDIKDNVLQIPMSGCTLYEAYLIQMRSYPELAQLIEGNRKAVGKLKFEIRNCRVPPKWGGIPPVQKRRVADSSWMNAIRFDERHPRYRVNHTQPKSPEVRFREAEHLYRVRHARFRFLELLRNGDLIARGIPEDQRYVGTVLDVPVEWWSSNLVAVNIVAGEIHRRSARNNEFERSWWEVRIFLRPKDRSPKRARPGRRSSKALILEEFARRADAGTVLEALSDEARELSKWLANHYPDEPQAQPKTIEAHIRNAFNAYWDEKSEP